jgi:hypothetical protein
MATKLLTDGRQRKASFVEANSRRDVIGFKLPHSSSGSALCHNLQHSGSMDSILPGELDKGNASRLCLTPGLLAWTDKTVGTHSELDCTRKLVWGNQSASWSTTELAHVRARLATALTGRSRHSRIIPSCWESWTQHQ